MCINIAVKHIETICRSIELCFKISSGRNNSDKEDIVSRMFKRNYTASESSEGVQCTTCNYDRDSTPTCETVVEHLLPELMDNREGGRNITTLECTSSIISSQNGGPSSGNCDICKNQAWNSDERMHHSDCIKDEIPLGNTHFSAKT